MFSTALPQLDLSIFIVLRPKKCWKYSPSNIITLLDKTNSSNSMIKCTFGITFWNWKHKFWIHLIASSTGMFVYKLLKSIVNKKQLLSNFLFSKSLTKSGCHSESNQLCCKILLGNAQRISMLELKSNYNQQQLVFPLKDFLEFSK